MSRAHGLRGEVLVSLTTNVEGRVDPGAVLRVGDRELTVAASRPHQGKWIVQFEGIADRSAAEALHQQAVYGEPVEDLDALWVHDLIGAEVVDVAGNPHGRVVAVIDNPASDLLELASGRLVPLTFVVEHQAGRIVVDPPRGLLDDDADG